MTPAACPECGRAVDPLRARAVGVRAGKVVAYCSADCKAKAEGGPTVRDDSAGTRVTVRTPAKGVPVAASSSAASSPIALAIPQSAADLDSGPIIEIIRERSEPAREPTPVPTRKPKRADTDTRAMQPPEDYDDSDLGPPEEDVPDDVQRRSPVTLILIAIVLAAVAAVVAFALK
jgi:hypothetical protein|nr:hypothetical protein [Kofleriaceae bacterium]